jgi:hypothetical protein
VLTILITSTTPAGARVTSSVPPSHVKNTVPEIDAKYKRNVCSNSLSP